MYSRCISCHARLGQNEVLEHLPVGRRLAFDSDTGRLWVLCTSCRAWNLAPLEERWEAVEAAERLFRSATVGASTDNIALGRVPEGTELLRVGRVNRPEFAAWRYGKQLLKRYRGQRMVGWSMAGAAGGVGIVTGLGTMGPIYGAMAAWLGFTHLRDRRPVTTLPDGRMIRRTDARKALLVPRDTGHGWSLEIPRGRKDPISLEGTEAVRALRKLLPRVTATASQPAVIENAVREVERLGSSGRVLREAAVALEDMDNIRDPLSRIRKWPHRIAAGHPVIAVAMEIAVNEETERRALAGELEILEREWREAEELARISDDLLLPRAIRDRIREWKGTPGG